MSTLQCVGRYGASRTEPRIDTVSQGCGDLLLQNAGDLHLERLTDHTANSMLASLCVSRAQADRLERVVWLQDGTA